MKKQLLSLALTLGVTVGMFTAVPVGAHSNVPCEISAVYTDSGYSVTVTNSGSAVSGVLYTVVYNQNEVMTGLKTQSVQLPKGSTTFTETLPESYNSNSSVKIMLWNEALTPLADAKTPAEYSDDIEFKVKNVNYHAAEGFYTAYYRVAFDESEADIKAFLNKIPSVKVENTEYTKVFSQPWYFDSTTNWWINGIDSYTNTVIGIDLSTDAFNKSGNTVIYISADGYKDIVLTCKYDGTIITGDNPGEYDESSDGLDVSGFRPYYNQVTKNTGNYQMYYYDSDSNAWMKKITGMTINDTVYSAGNASTSATYFIGSYSLMISDSAFKDGENTVLITSDGYKTMRMIITKNIYNGDISVTSVSNN